MQPYEDAIQPYQPPAEVVEANLAGVERVSKRLTIYCVIAIVLGALGLFNALMGFVALFVGPEASLNFAPGGMGDVPPEMQAAQRQMVEQLTAMQREFYLPNMAATVGRLVVATLLLAGGILAIRRVPTGRNMLLAGCGLAIVFELANSVLQAMVQSRTAAVTMAHMGRVMEAMGGQGPPEAAQIALTVTRVALIAGLVAALLMILAKVIYYALAIRYFRQPAVRTLYELPTAVETTPTSSFPA